VTRQLLWREYKAQHENGMGYVYFTQKYRAWKSAQGLSMRQTHKAGEKLFVDYAGMTLAITDQNTGEARQAQVFVATLGASNYTFAEATWSQSVGDWLGSHRRALEFLGGCPKVIVPDNLKTGVKDACYYEPEMNRAYAEFAQHYGLAVIPARVRKPKDKAKVEVGVQIVERDVLAVLRDRVFFSLAEANEAMRELVDALNDKAFQKRSGSRRSEFIELEKPELRPLPAHPFVVAAWKKATVGIDYHVEIDGHYYSVPHQHARAQVEVKLSSRTVEVFRKNQRIAAHERVLNVPSQRGRHTTITEHMPAAHQRYGQWSPRSYRHPGTTG
jgi:transposase